MRYVVYGAGAVGGVIGGRLHLAGIPATLVARGEHLDRVRDRGLTLDTADGVHVVRAPAADGASEISWTDDTVVLLTVKSHQTAVALDDLAVHAPRHTPVVSAQNGVANEAAILRRFSRTYSICVMLPAAHVEPGVVVQRCAPTPGILDVGRFPDGVDELTRAVATDLSAAGFSSQPRENAMAWKYRKLIMNLANGVGACCIAASDGFDELIRRAREEGERVIAAAGIAMVTEEEDARRRGDLLRGRSRSRATGGGSTWQSLERGTGDVEIDYLAGEVVLLGRMCGVPTPVNEVIQRATNRLASTGGRPASLDAADLLADLP